MIEMISTQNVRDWFKAAEDSDELYDSDLTYLSVGEAINFDSIPEGVRLKVVANNTARDYDSYGNRSVDGFMVFEVTDSDGVVQNFKLPVEYSSYEGWTYYINNITLVAQREKVVTSWEWIDA
jgi:hypothetical protein